MDFLSRPTEFQLCAAAALGIVLIAVCVLRSYLAKKTGQSGGQSEVFIFNEPDEDGADSPALKERDKQKSRQNAFEEQQKKAAEIEKNDLSALFEMDAAHTAARQRIDTQRETMTPELLKTNAAPPHELRAQLEFLTGEVSALIAKGLSDEQTAQNLLGRIQNAAVDELAPLIDAMLLLVRARGVSEQARALGVSGNMEQKAAMSALARGNPSPAVDFFQNRAKEMLQSAKSARGAPEKNEFMTLAGEFYRAGAAVLRPFDLNKSWDGLRRARECDPQNPVSAMMEARARHENGQGAKAREMFKDIAQSGLDMPDYVKEYVDKMIPQITAERTLKHAARIKENYLVKSGEKPRSKTADRRLIYDNDHDADRV